MEKYGVEIDKKLTCPKCGRPTNRSGLCDVCGSEPLEQKKGKSDEQEEGH